MRGIIQRRSRQRAFESDGLKLWTCAFGLGLVICAPIVRSSEETPQKNSEGPRNGIADTDSTVASGGVANVGVDKNNYCGKNWMDAYSNCPLACPNGNNSDCTTLGDGYSCQKFTLCHENQPTPTNAPTAEPSELVAISYPTCPADYSSGAGYVFGSIVAYSIPGGSAEDKAVYSCQGSDCNAGPPADDDANSWKLVGSCPSAAAASPTQATNVPQWWLSAAGTYGECVYGNDYPSIYITDEMLRQQNIFNSEEECCASYPDACSPSNSTTNIPAPGNTSEPTKAPSAEPTYTDTSYMPTMVPENCTSIHRQNFLFFFTTIFIVLLF